MNLQSQNLSQLANFIGFDPLFAELDRQISLKKSPNYPPYNIIKLDEYRYQIEMAVAGFSRDNIDISIEKNLLTVIGNTETKADVTYTYKGIAERSFSRAFTLADDVKVTGADIVNGMLIINMEHIIPEEKKPRKIVIGELKTVEVQKKQLLTE